MARHRQHGAPTRRGGAVDWLHPWWRKATLKLKKPLYDRVWWVETSTACTAVGVAVAWNTHGTLIEQACTSALAAVWLDASLCSHAILLERPLRAGSMSIMDELLRAGSIFTWAAQ